MRFHKKCIFHLTPLFYPRFHLLRPEKLKKADSHPCKIFRIDFTPASPQQFPQLEMTNSETVLILTILQLISPIFICPLIEPTISDLLDRGDLRMRSIQNDCDLFAPCPRFNNRKNAYKPTTPHSFIRISRRSMDQYRT